MNRRLWTSLVAVSLVSFAASSFGGAPLRAQTAGEPIRLSAWAVSMANVATGSTATLDIRVTKWSTEAERQQLIATFLEKGQDGLLKALGKVPVKGRISNPGKRGPDPEQKRLGWNLRFAMRTPLDDGGTRILIATDRVMSFEEVRNQPRSYDYPFTFIDIRLKSDGTGEGKMALATQLQFDKKKNTIVFENYSSEPVRLQNVKTEKNN